MIKSFLNVTMNEKGKESPNKGTYMEVQCCDIQYLLEQVSEMEPPPPPPPPPLPPLPPPPLPPRPKPWKLKKRARSRNLNTREPAQVPLVSMSDSEQTQQQVTTTSSPPSPRARPATLELPSPPELDQQQCQQQEQPQSPIFKYDTIPIPIPQENHANESYLDNHPALTLGDYTGPFFTTVEYLNNLVYHSHYISFPGTLDWRSLEEFSTYFFYNIVNSTLTNLVFPINDRGNALDWQSTERTKVLNIILNEVYPILVKIDHLLFLTPSPEEASSKRGEEETSGEAPPHQVNYQKMMRAGLLRLTEWLKRHVQRDDAYRRAEEWSEKRSFVTAVERIKVVITLVLMTEIVCEQLDLLPPRDSKEKERQHMATSPGPSNHPLPPLPIETERFKAVKATFLQLTDEGLNELGIWKSVSPVTEDFVVGERVNVLRENLVAGVVCGGWWAKGRDERRARFGDGKGDVVVLED